MREEAELRLAHRWLCLFDLDDKAPDHSAFPVNRHDRFRHSDIFRSLLNAVVVHSWMWASSRAKALLSVPASRKPTPVTITATQPMRSIGWSRRVVDRLDWRAKDQPTLPSYGREGLIYRNAVRIKSPILSKALLGVQDGS